VTRGRSWPLVTLGRSQGHVLDTRGGQHSWSSANPANPDLALPTTDVASATERIIERYAARWAIEVAFATQRGMRVSS